MGLLTSEEAKAFYDRLGSRQDSQRFYEDPAVELQLAQANFDEAHHVFEFGCGTGRYAETLLEHHLPLGATYRGVDLSETMVDLALERIEPYADRALVLQTKGLPAIDASDGSLDRVISNYVLDLLPNDEITLFLDEAHRVLTWDGYLCLISLTNGDGLWSRCVASTWSLVHRMRPVLLGGCRPLNLLDFLPQTEWEIVYDHVVTPYGIPSEVVVAVPKERCVESDAIGVA